MSAHIVVHTPEDGAVLLEGCPVSVIENKTAENASDLITVRQAARAASTAQHRLPVVRSRTTPPRPTRNPSRALSPIRNRAVQEELTKKSPHEAATSRRPDPERIKTNAHP